MIQWYETLYLDEKIAKKFVKVKKRIEQSKAVKNVYCILLSSNENNLLDIMNANELLFSYYQKKELLLVGVACSRASAMEIVRQIVQEIYEQTGDVDIRKYFSNR